MLQETTTSFQFHKGTIKTRQRFTHHPVAPRFQFHKGTIKTITDALDANGYTISIP